jgi:hypothetical protein
VLASKHAVGGDQYTTAGCAALCIRRCAFALRWQVSGNNKCVFACACIYIYVGGDVNVDPFFAGPDHLEDTAPEELVFDLIRFEQSGANRSNNDRSAYRKTHATPHATTRIGLISTSQKKDGIGKSQTSNANASGALEDTIVTKCDISELNEDF